MTQINLAKSDHAKELMKDIKIDDSEVEEVVEYAESEGKKLYKKGENRFLGKKKIGERTVYVEYSPRDDEMEIHAAWALRFSIEED
jgi:hypothetical protein